MAAKSAESEQVGAALAQLKAVENDWDALLLQFDERLNSRFDSAPIETVQSGTDFCGTRVEVIKSANT